LTKPAGFDTLNASVNFDTRFLEGLQAGFDRFVQAGLPHHQGG